LALPSNVVAYTVVPHKPPSPYRLPSASLRFQIPSLQSLLPDTKFFAVMRESETWTLIARAYFAVRAWYRRTVFGDRVYCSSYPCFLRVIQKQPDIILSPLFVT
jgi:hypothetical protein